MPKGKMRVAASEGIVGAAAVLKEPVVVPDVTVDPRYLMVNPETRSELAIPMIHKGQVIGVLDLESPQLNYVTEDHVQKLSILAANLAVSMENARLYEKRARDEARRLLSQLQNMLENLRTAQPGDMQRGGGEAQLLGVDLPLVELLSSSQQLGRSEKAAYVVGAERWLRPAPAWDRLVDRPRFGHCSILVNRAPSSVPDPDNGRVEANCRT